MKVRRYFAANMRSALEMVREEQGPDVMILSNKKVKGGIELVTAEGEIDDALVKQFAEESKENSRRRAAESKRTAQRPKAQVADESPSSAEVLTRSNGASLWSEPTIVDAMQRELSDLKGLLEQQLSGLAWNDFGNKHPTHARLLRDLSRAGIAPSLGRELLASLPSDLDFCSAWQFALDEFEERIHVLDDPILKHGGRVTLCGPTGVGKTLLACKLAAQFALQHGEDSVAIISTDEQRLGAQQQLKVFGGLLGIAVHSNRGKDDLLDSLENFEDKKLVIIDTAGAPVDDMRVRELVTQAASPEIAAKNYLVLSASTDYHSLSKILDAAGDLNFHGCLLTKLDEAAVLGPALSALVEAELPIAYISAGQQVPDDLETPIPHQLIAQTVTAAEEYPAEEDPSVIERAFMTQRG